MPSTYMDYPAAVELGKQIRCTGHPPTPLGDVARNSRARAANNAASGNTIVVTQDDSGKMVVCHAGYARCP